MKRCLILLCLLVGLSSVSGQPLLTVTFPALGDTISFDRVRFAGHTHPGAQMRVQGRSIYVYSNGAFVGRTDLSEGWNRLVFSATLENVSVSDTVTIYRPYEAPSLEPTPSRIDTTRIEPAQHVWVQPGDELELLLTASPHGKAAYSIESKRLSGKLIPGQHHSSQSYRTLLSIDNDWKPGTFGIDYTFRGKDGMIHTAKAPGLVTVTRPGDRLVGRVIDECTLLNDWRSRDPLTRLDPGIRLEINGRFGEYFRVYLDDNTFGFIHQKHFRYIHKRNSDRPAHLGPPLIRQSDEWLILQYPVSEPLPWLSWQRDRWIEIDLFGAIRQGEWITYPNRDVDIEHIRWRQLNDRRLRLELEMRYPPSWGYKIEYRNDRLEIRIRRSPFRGSPEAPLNGLIIAVDAGHGGEQEGAMGAMGIPEKQINLDIARQLESRLEHLGASVVMTRQTDQDVELADRVAMARRNKAHIFLSIHNNSVGVAGNPLAARGAGVFFYQPFAKPLAWAIYPHLIRLGMSPYGRIQNSFYVLRPTDMVSVLIECAFLSHPGDEMRLLQSGFDEQLAEAIARGVVDFVQNRNAESRF
ncbi:hypothetical protein GF406_22240 [candidate division KSB1 bacterium]|nr:hypothetical protein [candidate division KSB1 bacterium]